MVQTIEPRVFACPVDSVHPAYFDGFLGLATDPAKVLEDIYYTYILVRKSKM